MRTDRELLELAAKAEGRTLKIMTQIMADGSKEEFVACWHPGRDDGDCARMEAALGIGVEWYSDSVVVCKRERHSSPRVRAAAYAAHGGDRNSARRDASLQLAAAIGKAMP